MARAVARRRRGQRCQRGAHGRQPLWAVHIVQRFGRQWQLQEALAARGALGLQLLWVYAEGALQPKQRLVLLRQRQLSCQQHGLEQAALQRRVLPLHIRAGHLRAQAA